MTEALRVKNAAFDKWMAENPLNVNAHERLLIERGFTHGWQAREAHVRELLAVLRLVVELGGNVERLGLDARLAMQTAHKAAHAAIHKG